MALARPSSQRLNRLAIDVLAAAAASAEAAPISPEPSVRLALAWLSWNRVAEGWQVETFWKALTKPASPHGMEEYCRVRDLNLVMNRWRKVAGVGS